MTGDALKTVVKMLELHSMVEGTAGAIIMTIPGFVLESLDRHSRADAGLFQRLVFPDDGYFETFLRIWSLSILVMSHQAKLVGREVKRSGRLDNTGAAAALEGAVAYHGFVSAIILWGVLCKGIPLSWISGALLHLWIFFKALSAVRVLRAATK
eukprot:Hpha_TRINITY_DN8863_c0_g1::TRINITY_DN8863_c0_g1_i1::g.141529::m.141529